MRRTLLTLLMAALLTVGPQVTRGDIPVGSYAPDIEAKTWLNTEGGEAISLAERRGMIVVLFFWVTWNPFGEWVMPLMQLVNASRFGKRAGVYLIGVTDAKYEQIREMVEKEKLQFPIALEADETFKLYDFRDLTIPHVVIIDPRGKVAWSGWPGEKGGQTLIEELGKVAAATPPTVTHPDEARRARAYIAEARSALLNQEYQKAYRAASQAYDRALRGDDLKTKCQDLLDLIEAIGRDKFAQAERAVDEKRFDEAVQLLYEIRREFRGVDVASQARTRLKTLQKKYPEVAKILEQKQDEATAEAKLALALDQIRGRQFGEGWEAMEEIISEYDSTEAAAKAQTVMDRMRKNDDIMGYVRDYQTSKACQNLLWQADVWVRRGRVREAKELLRQVLDTYPDTVWAEKAAKELQKLP